MKAAFVMTNGRMAPCFAGVEVRLVEKKTGMEGEASSGLKEAEILSTKTWHPLQWGRELALHGVNVLLCAGIMPGTWAAVCGNGIEVIPNAMGAAENVLALWCGGKVTPPQTWPAYPPGAAPFMKYGAGIGRRRRRLRGGKW